MEFIKPLLLFIAGIGGGLYASTVGGGSLVSFPLLVLAGLPIHAAVATNRFAAVILEFASAIKFFKEKKLDFKLGLILSAFAIAGATLGAKITLSIDDKSLNLIVSGLFIIAFLVLFNKDKLKIKEKAVTKKNFILAEFATFLLSIYGGFFGAGFGFFIIIAMVLLGFNFIKSAALGRMIEFFMSLTGAIVFAQSGSINFLYGASLGAGFAIGSWIGIGFALKKGEEYVKKLLLIIVALSLLKLLLNAFGVKI